jgi:hypothetical protein
MRRAQIPCYGIRGAMAYPRLGGEARDLWSSPL